MILHRIPCFPCKLPWIYSEPHGTVLSCLHRSCCRIEVWSLHVAKQLPSEINHYIWRVFQYLAAFSTRISTMTFLCSIELFYKGTWQVPWASTCLLRSHDLSEMPRQAQNWKKILCSIKLKCSLCGDSQPEEGAMHVRGHVSNKFTGGGSWKPNLQCLTQNTNSERCQTSYPCVIAK